MLKKFRRQYIPILAFAAIASFLAPRPVCADQPLSFKKTSGADIREQSVLSWMTAQKLIRPEETYSYAAVDLNYDGIQEWIIRSDKPGCQTSAACLYIIAALKSGSPTILGRFTAGKIGVSDQKLYGIRNILAYNDKNNDLTYRVIYWHPNESTYGP